jgi:hypothetical protein
MTRRRRRFATKSLALLICGTMAAALVSCKGSEQAAASAPRSSSTRASPAASGRADRAASNDIKQKLSRSTSLLMDSLQKPTTSYHFAFKAQENINSKFPADKTAKPEVGPYELEGDFTPDETNFTSVRGTQKAVHKAGKDDELARGMANLELIGPVTSTGLIMAFAQLVAQPSGSEALGGVEADKYQFDTTTAVGSTKAGLDIAKGLLTNIQSTRGTVWLEKSSGKLVKFNIDADFADNNNHAWKEHYDGELTRK